MSVEVVEDEEKEKEVEGRQRQAKKDVSGCESNGIDSACGDDSVVESKKAAPVLGKNAIL